VSEARPSGRASLVSEPSLTVGPHTMSARRTADTIPLLGWEFEVILS